MSAKAKRRSVWAIWSIVLVGIAVLVLWDITSTVAQKQSQFIIGSLNELSSKQNSIVGICQSNDPDLGGLQAPLDATLTYEQVDSITKLAIQRAGGFGPVIEANDWVLIKVNMITVPYVPGNWTWSKQGTCTDLRVGKSVIEQLIELDIPLHITVAEGGTWRKLGEPNCPPSQTEDGWTVHWSHYGNLSWEDMTAELDTFPLVTVDYMDLNYSSQSPYTERPVPGGGYSQSSYYIPDAIVNCNKLIAIPAMKTHGLARVTLSNKLYVGISPAEVYNQDYWNHMGLPHSGAEPDQIEKTIVDLMSYHPPDFVVIPCFWGIEGAGPWKAGEGKSLKGTSIKRNLVIAGRDPVSVDAATVTAMGRNPYDIETLYLANQKGYGNWRLDKIDVAGPSLEEVAYDWAMPSVRGLGYYQGRGNRTWLINGSYSGIDLDYDYLGGEAGVSPVEGDSSGGLEWTAVGWTNMRDYCDLAAYFGSPSNCISYAFTRIIADSAQTAYLRLGADDGIKVWLNGVIEYQNNNTGSWSMIQNYPGVQINLQEGVNDLLVKVKNEGGAYGFSLYISESDGDTPLGIKYSILSPVAPVVELEYPANGASTTNDSMELAATVTDPDEDSMTVWIYGDISDASDLFYVQENVASGSYITYNWTAPVLTADTSTIGLWHFDEGSGDTVYDASPNGNHGTIFDATWTVGRFGSALHFDGVDDYVRVLNSPSLNPTSAISIELWTYREDNRSWSKMLSKPYGLGAWPAPLYVTYGLAMQTRGSDVGNLIEFPISINGQPIGMAPEGNSYGAVPLFEWHYIAVTFDGQYHRIYIDGQLDREEYTPGTIDSGYTPGSDLFIGSAQPDLSVGGYYLGSLDEVRISNRTRTDQEIADAYRLGVGSYAWKVKASDGANETTSETRYFSVLSPTPDTLPPVITLNRPPNDSTTTSSFMELSTTVSDPDGSPMTLWIYGDQNPNPTNLVYQESSLSSPSTVTYVWGSLPQELEVDTNTAGLWHFNENSGTTASDETANNNDGTISGATWTTGRFGFALSFDGVDDYVQMSDAASLDITGDLTLEAWIKPDALTADHAIITKRDAGGTCNYQMYLNSDNEGLSFYAGGATEYQSSLIPTVGQWSYVAIVRSGTTLDFYLDDQTVQMSGPATLTANNQPLQIGSRSVGSLPEAFDGTMDEVRITNRALTPQEIAANYSSELAGGRYYWNGIVSDGVNEDTSETRYFDVVAPGPDTLPPVITLNSPDSASATTADSAILSATVDDPEGNPMTVWFYGDQNPDPTTLLYQESDVSDPSTVTYL
ncbi:MAG: LamG-like jellyroll fold domain-containing protein, partial [bacterium]